MATSKGIVTYRTGMTVERLTVSKADTDRTSKAMLATWLWSAPETLNYHVVWYIWEGVKWRKDRDTYVKTKYDRYTPANTVTKVRVFVRPFSKKYKAKVNKKQKEFSYWIADGIKTQAVAVPSWSPEKAGAARITVGQSSNKTRDLIAEWVWNKAKTTSYTVEWQRNTYPGGPFLEPEQKTATVQNSTYSVPDGTYQIRVRVLPLTSSGDWEASWSDYAYFYASNLVPEVAPTPTVTLKQYSLEAYVNIIGSTATKVTFEIISDNNKSIGTWTVNLSRNYAGITVNVPAGHQYKVRCLAKNNNQNAQSWSEYSDNVYAAPPAPGNFTSYKALTSTSVELTWPGSSYADSYTIEYTNNKAYFDAARVESVTITSGTRAIITGLDSETGDNTWFFRCRATKDNSNSAWNSIVSVTVGRRPTAPTTWSLTSTVSIGDTIKLYWIHNTRDNSRQREAKIEIIINGVSTIETLHYDPSGEDEEGTYEYDIDSSEITDGTEIKWRVMTKGLSPDYSEWSTLRSIKIYAPATIIFDYESGEGFPEVFNWLPIDVFCEAGPSNRSALRYVITVTSQEAYEIMNLDGTTSYVNANDTVFSEVIYPDERDTNHLKRSLGPEDISLSNQANYTIRIMVVTDTGLSASCSADFTVEWEDIDMIPNAEIGSDEDYYAAYIKPYCNDSENNPVTDVLLSVFRKNVDGTYTEISANLDAEDEFTVIDPHPPFGTFEYRITSRSKVSGQIAYSDLLALVLENPAIILQWDEIWEKFQESEDVTGDEEDTRWTGSLIRLPYNVDVQDTKSPDVEFVEYIGREHPVSYYGTQKGETATWNTVIEADDVDTLNALRRLAIWMGDVYVREPSGTGYWAQVNVRIAQKHMELTIPITLQITRVEGGA